MKSKTYFRALFMASLLLMSFTAFSQTTNTTKKEMKTYLIQRDIPGAEKFTAAELKSISITSCDVLDEMGPKIKWMHSYVVGDHIYCVYQAENEDLIREHGSKGKFPVTKIMEVTETISPATAK